MFSSLLSSGKQKVGVLPCRVISLINGIPLLMTFFDLCKNEVLSNICFTAVKIKILFIKVYKPSSLILRIPHLSPLIRRFHTLFFPIPKHVTSPTPVTTTRRAGIRRAGSVILSGVLLLQHWIFIIYILQTNMLFTICNQRIETFFGQLVVGYSKLEIVMSSITIKPDKDISEDELS